MSRCRIPGSLCQLGGIIPALSVAWLYRILLRVVHYQPPLNLNQRETVPSSPIPRGRRYKRIVTKKRASLVINLSGIQKMLPCLIVDKSQEGFRLRASFRLRRGQLVELVVDDPMMDSVQCEVIWIGKAGSEQAEEIGLQAIAH